MTHTDTRAKINPKKEFADCPGFAAPQRVLVIISLQKVTGRICRDAGAPPSKYFED
jgi:hypothetical protein